MLDTYITDGTVDSDEFCKFIERCLLPQLLPFNGYNPSSVVIMDNAAIHRAGSAIQMIEEVGALVHFLPHSPDEPYKRSILKSSTF